MRRLAVTLVTLALLTGCRSGTALPRGEPISGQMALTLTGSLQERDVLNLSEVNGFALGEDEPPYGFMDLEWDGHIGGAEIKGPSKTGTYTEFTFWVGVETADGTVYQFTTESAKNRGKCSLSIERADLQGIQGRVQCTGLTGYLSDRTNTLYEPSNAPHISAVATFSGQAEN